MGAVAAIGFLFMTSSFRCCEGEDGFAKNVSVGSTVAVTLLIGSLIVQQRWRERPFLSILIGVGLFAVLMTILLSAGPRWNDYVFSRQLYLGWRTAGVFAAAAAATYLFLWPLRPRAMTRP